MRFLCLHGFLGQVDDWSFLPAALSAQRLTAPVVPLSLWPWADRELDLEGAAAALAAQGRKGDVLVGYSLGGRLAALAFTRSPERWSALVMLSAHPGGLPVAERARRRETDSAWARRFETEPWSTVLAAWNAQPVFAGSNAPPMRPEGAIPPAALAWALTHWSVAAQPDLRPALAAADRPVVWLAGMRDKYYASLAPELRTALPRARVRVLLEAGHRLLWQAPCAVAAELAALAGGAR